MHSPRAALIKYANGISLEALKLFGSSRRPTMRGSVGKDAFYGFGFVNAARIERHIEKETMGRAGVTS